MEGKQKQMMYVMNIIPSIAVSVSVSKDGGEILTGGVLVGPG